MTELLIVRAPWRRVASITRALGPDLDVVGLRVASPDVILRLARCDTAAAKSKRSLRRVRVYDLRERSTVVDVLAPHRHGRLADTLDALAGLDVEVVSGRVSRTAVSGSAGDRSRVLVYLAERPSGADRAWLEREVRSRLLD